MCVVILEDHVLVSEFSLALQEKKVLEALTHDIDVPCIVQWRMLWYSAPTSLDNALLNDGVILETFNEPMNWAFQSAFVLPHWRMNTPRSRFLRSIRAMLEGVTEWVWDPERDMHGWEQGGRPDLLLDDEDDEQDEDNGPEDL